MISPQSLPQIHILLSLVTCKSSLEDGLTWAWDKFLNPPLGLLGESPRFLCLRSCGPLSQQHPTPRMDRRKRRRSPYAPQGCSHPSYVKNTY